MLLAILQSHQFYSLLVSTGLSAIRGPKHAKTEGGVCRSKI